MVELIKQYDALNSELFDLQGEINLLQFKAKEIDEQMQALKYEIEDYSKGAGITKSIIAGWKLSFSTSSTTIIEEPDLIPMEYNKTEIKPDVMKIKQYIKSGYTIPGCYLKTNKNFSLKKL